MAQLACGFLPFILGELAASLVSAGRENPEDFVVSSSSFFSLVILISS